MILEVDLGNTRGKWRLLEAGESVARGGLSLAEVCGGQPPRDWVGLRPQRVRAANVAGEAAARGLSAAVRQQFALPVEFARVQPSCAGVTCGYRDVERLGVDRWLAVLAAYRRDPRAALIVDCGSAVTIDLLDTGGRHLGGYILPGLDLMRRALYSDTDAVKVSQACRPGMTLTPGRDTADAVNHGLPLMVLGAIEQSLDHLGGRDESGEPLLWLTGGDGSFFSSLCQRQHQLVPDLVFEGLALTNP